MELRHIFLDILHFLELCGPSVGVFDHSRWESDGFPHILSADYSIPMEERRIHPLSLEHRMAVDDWSFASAPGGVESIEASHSALEALYWTGRFSELSESNRAAWVAYFNSFQDKDTGYYLGPYVPERAHPSWENVRTSTHPWDHMHDHLISCLGPGLILLGGKPRFPLSDGSQTGRFLDRSYLERFLSGRDWTGYIGDGDYRRHNPWYFGNEYWYPACILWMISEWEAGTPAGVHARELLDSVWYEWHDTNFDETGFWRGDLAGPADRIWQPANYWHRVSCPVMGGAHQLWFYDFDGHPIPEKVRSAQTDLLLSMQNQHDGMFGLGNPTDMAGAGSSDCTDVDCTTLLAINYKRQDYRREEIRVALERAAKAILSEKLGSGGVLASRPGGAWSHGSNATATYSPSDSANILQQSFYLWAVIASLSVLGYTAPRLPTYWLWIP